MSAHDRSAAATPVLPGDMAWLKQELENRTLESPSSLDQRYATLLLNPETTMIGQRHFPNTRNLAHMLGRRTPEGAAGLPTRQDGAAATALEPPGEDDEWRPVAQPDDAVPVAPHRAPAAQQPAAPRPLHQDPSDLAAVLRVSRAPGVSPGSPGREDEAEAAGAESWTEDASGGTADLDGRSQDMLTVGGHTQYTAASGAEGSYYTAGTPLTAVTEGTEGGATSYGDSEAVSGSGGAGSGSWEEGSHEGGSATRDGASWEDSGSVLSSGTEGAQSWQSGDDAAAQVPRQKRHAPASRPPFQTRSRGNAQGAAAGAAAAAEARHWPRSPPATPAPDAMPAGSHRRHSSGSDGSRPSRGGKERDGGGGRHRRRHRARDADSSASSATDTSDTFYTAGGRPRRRHRHKTREEEAAIAHFEREQRAECIDAIKAMEAASGGAVLRPADIDIEDPATPLQALQFVVKRMAVKSTSNKQANRLKWILRGLARGMEKFALMLPGRVGQRLDGFANDHNRPHVLKRYDTYLQALARRYLPIHEETPMFDMFITFLEHAVNYHVYENCVPEEKFAGAARPALDAGIHGSNHAPPAPTNSGAGGFSTHANPLPSAAELPFEIVMTDEAAPEPPVGEAGAGAGVGAGAGAGVLPMSGVHVGGVTTEDVDEAAAKAAKAEVNAAVAPLADLITQFKAEVLTSISDIRQQAEDTQREARATSSSLTDGFRALQATVETVAGRSEELAHDLQELRQQNGGVNKQLQVLAHSVEHVQRSQQELEERTVREQQQAAEALREREARFAEQQARALADQQRALQSSMERLVARRLEEGSDAASAKEALAQSLQEWERQREALRRSMETVQGSAREAQTHVAQLELQVRQREAREQQLEQELTRLRREVAQPAPKPAAPAPATPVAAPAPAPAAAPAPVQVPLSPTASADLQEDEELFDDGASIGGASTMDTGNDERTEETEATEAGAEEESTVEPQRLHPPSSKGATFTRPAAPTAAPSSYRQATASPSTDAGVTLSTYHTHDAVSFAASDAGFGDDDFDFGEDESLFSEGSSNLSTSGSASVGELDEDEEEEEDAFGLGGMSEEAYDAFGARQGTNAPWHADAEYAAFQPPPSQPAAPARGRAQKKVIGTPTITV